MLTLPTFFDDFLTDIRPTPAQRSDYRDGHQLLRRRLRADPILAPLIVTTFLQGSVRRATATRPRGGDRPDVDVVVVTEIPRTESPAAAMDRFVPFLDQHYAGKWSPNDRSFRIELSKVKLDLVITSKADDIARVWTQIDVLDADDPLDIVARWDSLSPALDDWKKHPIWIPDRRLEHWQATHPLAQIRWTWQMNQDCDGHYVNVVKALKWWKSLQDEPAYPKSYPLEHLIGACCPAGLASVAEGVTFTLEAIRELYAGHARQRETPVLRDHGVEQNVMQRVSGDDFHAFHALVTAAADVARSALEDVSKRHASEQWVRLFGDRFPIAAPDDDDDGPGGFSKRGGPTILGGARYG